MSESKHSLLQQIGRTGRAMYAAFEAEVGQPLPRWRILQHLSVQGELSQKQLAQDLQMDPGALTRQMKVLERDGLVSRLSDERDNRLTRVTLTPAARTLLRDSMAQRDGFIDKALDGLPPEQLESARQVLRQLEENFRAMVK